MLRENSTKRAGAGLIVDRVRIEAGSVRILHDVSVALRPGELCALIGPSGAGKSTLIKALLGLWEPDEGVVTCDGQDVAEAGPVGYVPQDDAVHRGLTVRQALDFAARLRAPALPRDRVGRLVAGLCRRLDLAQRLDVRIKRLSGGQRKRVSVAMELITDPSVLVLDEPTSGLDPGLEARLMQLFAEVSRGGRVVLVATHAMQSLDLCDALLILMQGRVVYLGPPAAAPTHFGADDYSGIFHRLGERSASSWESTYRMSADCRAFRERPGRAPDSTGVKDDGGRVIIDRRAASARSADAEASRTECAAGPVEPDAHARGWPPPRRRSAWRR
jgi:ABC-type multidrug transport system ATPase subunit